MSKLSDTSKKFFAMLDKNGAMRDKSLKGDILCLKNALDKFLFTGAKEDAFTVFFCYSEIFGLFGKGYENTKRLLGTLSDHEYHSGELLAAHRDHYSHSVYVFALGLSLYAADCAFRSCYLDFYGMPDNGGSACFFLRHWGMTALFHDIGYPFQLAHSQIKAYVNEVFGENPRNPYVSFGNMKEFLELDENLKTELKRAVGREIENLNELLAYGLEKRMGYDFKKVCEVLLERVVFQPEFMDHGYFGAIILLKQLFASDNIEINDKINDVATAILLHNSFNKYDAPDRRPIRMGEHPLAYLLILCDELQCWDRFAYGKQSKRMPLACDIDINISENLLDITYFYEEVFIDREGEKKLNSNYEEMLNGVFSAKIFGTEKDALGKRRIAYISSDLKLSVNAQKKHTKRRTREYASDNNFANLLDMAKAVHASYNEQCVTCSENAIDEDFAALPLEFKLSNIENAKSYSEKLEKINCFYSSKSLDFSVIESFDEAESGAKDNVDFLCRLEHIRWVKEKLGMGWQYGKNYNDALTRNRLKIHKDLVPYDILPEKERHKDRVMINNIIPLLKKFGSNIKIYNYKTGNKPDLTISATGHRFLGGNRQAMKKKIKNILSAYSKNYNVILRTCFAGGADQLVAECAAELGLMIKATLPLKYEAFIADVKKDAELNGKVFGKKEEKKMRSLLAQVYSLNVITDSRNVYAAASDYIINNCQKLIAVWDGVQTPLVDGNNMPINQGGTYYCIMKARQSGLREEDIHIIGCKRG